MDSRLGYKRVLATEKYDDKQEYRRLSNIVRSKTRRGQQKGWDRYILDLETDIHGRQIMAYKVMRHLN